jgi:hypothetical protein
MSLLDSRVTRRAALVAGGGGALVAATAAVASAGDDTAARTDGRGHGHGRVIDVRVTTADGFRLPRAVRAGLVTFRFHAPEEDYHAIQGFALKPGADLAEIIETIRAGVGDDRVAAAAAHRKLLAEAVLVGGAVGIQDPGVTVTLPLDAGTYYFIDYNDYFTEGMATPRLHTLRVVGDRGRLQLPAYDAAVNAVPHDMEHMEHEEGQAETFGFDSPTTLPRRGTFLMINASDEIHDIGWRRAKPGTTDEYLAAYYKAVTEGTPLPGPSPWLEPNLHGLQGVAPGRYAVVSVKFAEAGDYVLVCYVPSKVTGVPHTLDGMFKVTHLV